MKYFSADLPCIQEPANPPVGRVIIYRALDGQYKMKDCSGQVFILGIKEEDKDNENT